MEELDGEWFNEQIKKLLPDDELSSFTRNFLAYKLSQIVKKTLPSVVLDEGKMEEIIADILVEDFGGEIPQVVKDISHTLATSDIYKDNA